MPIDSRAGIKVNSFTVGEGHSQALFLHCSLANSRVWLPIVDHLKDSLSVTAFDLPGHGMSQDWDYSSDYQESCLNISATFINKPLHIVGHSFGATVALRVAHRYPNFVESLSLIEPVFFAAAFADYYELKERFMSDHAEYFKAGLNEDWDLAAKLFLKLWGNNENWALLNENKKRQFVKRIPLTFETSQAIYEDPHEMLKKQAFSSLKGRCSIIYGDRSHFIMPYICKALSVRIPNSKLKTVENAGHMLPITHPELCARILNENIVT